MRTQCPNCGTIFALAEQALRAKQGLVRCGRCREVFNASWNLIDFDPGSGEKMSAPAAGGPERSPSVAADEGPPADAAPQQWTVSEHGAGADPSRPRDQADESEEAVTETLQISDVASTEEVASLGASAEVPGRSRGRTSEGAEFDLPREVDEEIVIEAPTNLWQLEAQGEPAEAAGGAETATRERPEPRVIPVARLADDVKLVEIPQPRAMRSLAWMGSIVVLSAAVFWQLRAYYVSDLAELPSLRGAVEAVCEYASCTVPPRTDIKRIDLLDTSVDPHPDTPGALRVSANLVNRASFEQPFPPLEVTLTDREGEVVGRRTYLPHEYRSGAPGDMSPNVVERADLDLAQPAQTAVGYEIQLVSR